MSKGVQDDRSVGRGRRLLAGCLLCVLVMFLGCGGWLWWSSQRGWTVEKLEQSIRAEAPPGCDRKTAEDWLDRHGLGYDWYEDTTGDMRGRQTVAQVAGLDSRNLSGMLRGRLDTPEANVGLGGFINGYIYVYFFFDKQGRCAGHLVEPFDYMP